MAMRRKVVFGEGRTNTCFGCGGDNPRGLRLEFFETAEGVEAEYNVPEHLQGAPGIAHGGIQATILDEVLCMTAYAKLGTSVFTGELTVRYVQPVPTETPLVIRGRITESRGRSSFIEGAIHLAATGEELTRARGRFFPQKESREAGS
jgi:acyl-coenzyme A thioesterase PaaI-like protein